MRGVLQELICELVGHVQNPCALLFGASPGGFVLVDPLISLQLHRHLECQKSTSDERGSVFDLTDDFISRKRTSVSQRFVILVG